MRKEDLFGAFPLFLRSRNLVRLELPLLKVWESVDDDPRDAAAKVYNRVRTVMNRVNDTF